MRKSVFVSIFFIFLSVSLVSTAEETSETLSAVHCKIEKVTRKEMLNYDEGRAEDNTGYQYKNYDKFYWPKKELPASEKGEYHDIEWRCWGLEGKEHQFQLVFEYDAENTVQKKKIVIDLSVKKDGFYETPVEHKGEDFQKDGRIEAWRASLRLDGKVLAVKTSTLWSDELK